MDVPYYRNLDGGNNGRLAGGCLRNICDAALSKTFVMFHVKHITMKKIKLGAHELTVYDSIEELPILRFHKFNKALIIDAHIGTTVADAIRHLQKTILLIQSKRTEDAVTELQNMQQSLNFMQNDVSPKSMAFAALVAEIDGKRNDDLSDTALADVSEKINDVAVAELNKAIAAQKKKIEDELTAYFGDMVNDNADKSLYDIIRRRALLQLEAVTEEREPSPEIEELTKKIVLHSKPKCFTGNNNFETLYDKQFQRVVLALSQRLNVDAKQFTVMEYYNAIELCKQQDKEINKKLRNK